MKRYLTKRARRAAPYLAAVAVTAAMFSPQQIDAQDASDKIKLMAETLRARDSGNLTLAKEKAEELIKIAPNDENVQRLNASINREIERQQAEGGAVYGQAADATVETAMEGSSAPTTAAPVAAADSLADQVAAEQAEKVAAAEQAIVEANQLADLGAYDDAAALLTQAAASLQLNTATADTLADIQEAKADVLLIEAKALAESGDQKGAEEVLKEYVAAGGSASKARSLGDKLDGIIRNPYDIDIAEVSPEFVAEADTIRDLLTRGRAQFLNGDYDGAAATFKQVEARDANNAEAKLFSTKIAEILAEIHDQTMYKTREQMLSDVGKQWERPKVYDIAGTEVTGPTKTPLTDKLDEIIIPQVNFSGMELTRVVETLSELSVEYDRAGEGVNIVPLFDANDRNPRVNISLRKLSLAQILNFVTQQVSFNYDVGETAVTVSWSGETNATGTLTTDFFPITRATIIRLIGTDDAGGGGFGADPFGGGSDPFAPAPVSTGGGGGDDKAEKLKAFFQSAGVNFEIGGASLAFDGEQLIVTQTRRNLERLQAILRRYNEVKQVEIETKFLEVAQNDLEELGFDWTVQDGKMPIFDENGAPVLDDFGRPTYTYDRTFETQGRNLNSTFGTGLDASAIVVNGNIEAINRAPQITDTIDLAADAANLFTATGWSINGYEVDLAINALSRKTGSDLMSAPKVTVLSGKRASITVAQELRYPESYGDIESTAGGGGGTTSGTTSGGGASISITAGTPEDFVTRNVGVELTVTPNVENDDTISLLLEPRVTEFEGFVEYGGPSVAIVGGGALSGGTTVTVPAGFYQPIFSTRELTTEVTVFDGATVVMGGLTRDEVKYYEDKVPVVGDIPGIGKLFRSEGETRQKRNLLIFVTANLVSPGGSPARQNFRHAKANALFQNPTIMTPSGSVNRTIEEDSN